MEFALIQRQGLMVLTGDAGTGKSMLIQHFTSKIDDTYQVYQFNQTHLNEAEFLDLMVRTIGEFGPDGTVPGMMQELNVILETIHKNDKHCVIIVDDAHSLSVDVLLRLVELSQCKVDKERICTVFLVGDNTLWEKLDASSIRDQVPNINSKYQLGVLTLPEIRKYIYHRLAVAGGHQSIEFSKDVFPVVEAYTGGRPRLINVLVDHVLTYAYLQDINQITTKVIDSAVVDLQWLPFGVKKNNQKVDPEKTFTEERRSSYKIVISSQDKVRGEYFIRKKRVSIGRHKENDLRIDDPMISRQHAQIIRQGRTTYLRDLNSTNGTFVNNRRVDIAPLEEGTVIRMGSFKLTYTRSTKNSPPRTHSDNVREFASKNK